MQFLSFAHYCRERLGMAGRTVEQRVALERCLYELPELRAAMQAGRVGYEKARVIARAALELPVEDLIERATGTTCVDLQRELEQEEQAQMCAQGDVLLRVPEGVRHLVATAVQAARERSEGHVTSGEALAAIAEHFIATWKGQVRKPPPRRRRVLGRKAGRCQVPGCSRSATHEHHVVYRSRGGSDDESNRAAVCAAHHLHGIHMGYVRVTGQAPDGLRWELGVRGARALVVLG